MGSRFELYGNLNSTGEPWTGYMVHSTPNEEIYNLVHAFPVRINNESEFIVMVGQGLQGSVDRFISELNVQAELFNVSRLESLYLETDTPEDSYIKSRC